VGPPKEISNKRSRKEIAAVSLLIRESLLLTSKRFSSLRGERSPPLEAPMEMGNSHLSHPGGLVAVRPANR